jgi:hypothetical protein
MVECGSCWRATRARFSDLEWSVGFSIQDAIDISLVQFFLFFLCYDGQGEFLFNVNRRNGPDMQAN